MFEVNASPEDELLHLSIPALLSGYLEYRNDSKVNRLLEKTFGDSLTKGGKEYLTLEGLKHGARGALKGLAGKAAIDYVFGPSESFLGLLGSNIAGLSLAEAADWGIRNARLADSFGAKIKNHPYLADLKEVQNLLKNSRLKNFLEGVTYGLAKGSLRGAGAGLAAIAAEKAKQMMFGKE